MRAIKYLKHHSLALLTAAALTLGAAARAEINTPARVRAFAQLPDWSGIWENDQDAAKGTANAPKGYADTSLLTLAAMPPYTTAWRAKVEAAIKAGPHGLPPKKCIFGFPADMNSPVQFQLWVEPQETLILFDSDDVRHVYTDGRKHPSGDDLWPTPLGDSIGHWEGQTLVIHTIARRNNPGDTVFLNPLYTVSARFHVTERIRMINHDRIENVLTLEDPLAFAHPWTVTEYYKRVTDLDRLLWESCTDQDYNPIVNGVMTFSPP